MTKKLTLHTGVTITVADTPFASGAEGDLHTILSPAAFAQSVVKVYKANKQTPERQQKILYLVNNPPQGLIGNTQHCSVCWMTHIVYEQGQFVGFVMPKVEGISLELLCHNRLKHPKLNTTIWQRFALDNPSGLQLRLKLCFNIAVALQHIHAQGCYVLVDMKPDNIMIQANGLVSIIDIDSIAVLNSAKQIIYPAVVMTADYAPPEYYLGSNLTQVNHNWDNFSLAIIFYRLLCGIHPFVGTCHPPYENYSEIMQHIQAGLFPHGQQSKYFQVIPPPHSRLYQLDKALQTLFIQCFEQGHVYPNTRPKVENWCSVLQSVSKPFLTTPILTGNATPPISSVLNGNQILNKNTLSITKIIRSLGKFILFLFFSFILMIFVVDYFDNSRTKLELKKTTEKVILQPVHSIPKPNITPIQPIPKPEIKPIKPVTEPIIKEINTDEIHDCLLSGNCNNHN